MALSATEKLRRFYDRFACDDQVLVVINADPDAIASAMAVKRLLWRKVSSVSICHINTIKRPDNLAMIRLLGVPLSHMDQTALDRFTRFIIVDSQPDHDQAFSRITPDVIIDHHPESSNTTAFSDIRPKYGATASIMTEYLRAAKIKPSVKLATGLFHAIKTDTKNFQRQLLLEDIRAFQFLYRHANIHLVRKIEQADMRPEFLKYFKKALESRRVRKGRVFVHLGTVINPDVCVLIADFFMRVNTINWSIVSGISENKLTVIFRNDGIRKNAGRVAKEGFGQLGSAGGHKSMARAEIRLTQLKEVIDYKDEKKLLRWIISQIKKKPGKRDGI